jgi:hypothetical protein
VIVSFDIMHILQIEKSRREQRYWYRNGTCGTRRLPWVIVVCSIIMNREFKHWWPSTPPISTKLTITSYLNIYRLFIYVLSLEIQLSKRGEDCDPINWHNPATCLCLFQARTWIRAEESRDTDTEMAPVEPDVYREWLSSAISLWTESLNIDGHRLHQYQQN